MELEHEFTVPVPMEAAWPLLLDVERVVPCMPGATLDSVEGDAYVGRLKVRLNAMTITYRGSARIVSADERERAVTIEGFGKEARGSGTATATINARLHREDDSTRVSVRTKLKVTGRPAQFERNILSEAGAKLIDRFAKALALELEPGRPPEAVEVARMADTVEAVEAVEAAPALEAIEPALDIPEAEGTAASPAEGTAASPAEGTAASPVEAQDIVDQQAAAQAVASTVDAAATAHRDEPATATGVTGEPPLRPVTPISSARRNDDDNNDAINLMEVAGPTVAKRAAPVVAALVAVFAIRHLVRRRRGRHHRR